MSLFLNKFVFLYYPYIALAIFFCGSIYRYEYDQYSWKSSSSQILEKKLLFWGSNFFHFGIIFLMAGHFVGLMTPKFLYSMIISPEKKQLVAMSAGGVAGIVCLIGLVILIYRRLFFTRIYITSSKFDILVLLLLFIQLTLGLLSIFISYQHIENPASMIAFANWTQGIFLFSKDLHLYVINEHWIFKCHLFLGMTILLIFPFTRLVHIFSFPYLYLLRDGYQIVRNAK